MSRDSDSSLKKERLHVSEGFWPESAIESTSELQSILDLLELSGYSDTVFLDLVKLRHSLGESSLASAASYGHKFDQLSHSVEEKWLSDMGKRNQPERARRQGSGMQNQTRSPIIRDHIGESASAAPPDVDGSPKADLWATTQAIMAEPEAKGELPFPSRTFLNIPRRDEAILPFFFKDGCWVLVFRDC